MTASLMPATVMLKGTLNLLEAGRVFEIANFVLQWSFYFNP